MLNILFLLLGSYTLVAAIYMIRYSNDLLDIIKEFKWYGKILFPLGFGIIWPVYALHAMHNFYLERMENYGPKQIKDTKRD